jgi:hypothetical protein
MSASLHDLVAPPPRAGFRDELWERAEAAERRAARRWRAVAIAAVACAVAATTAAGVFAVRSEASLFTGTYDRTFSCPVPIEGGIPVVRLTAHATYSAMVYGTMTHYAAAALLSDAAGNSLGGVSSVRRGYGYIGDTCTKAPLLPTASAAKLPLYEVFKPGETGVGVGTPEVSCFVGGHVRVRVRAAVRRDVVTGATLTLWTGTKKVRPVVYVDWAPKRVAVHFSDDCHD